jgi:hypothetical protein
MCGCSFDPPKFFCLLFFSPPTQVHLASFRIESHNKEIKVSTSSQAQGKKYRPIESEISEISRLPAGSEIFPLSPEIFIFLKFCHPNRRQNPPNTLTLIHV